MSAGWVAGGVRAQAMARRRLGVAAARELAAAPVRSAITILAASPYGRRVRVGDTATAASRGVADTLLWNMRVLAGWVPVDGASTLRLLAGWFEIANVDEHLRALSGRSADPPFSLGTLATAWPRLRAASSHDELRAALAASAWGDPGGAAERAIALGMRLAWADRVAARVRPARAWAMGAAALVVARERFALGGQLPEGAAATAARLLGPRPAAAGTLDAFVAALPGPARWALADLVDPTDLWAAEARWWRRLAGDGARLMAGSRLGPDRLVGVVAMLAADAAAVRGALELAARGRGPEVFDAVA
jgi:hypothetical protein